MTMRLAPNARRHEVAKQNANDYTTSLTGLRFKIAHKRAGSEKWSAKPKTQRKRMIMFLQSVIADLQKQNNTESDGLAARQQQPARGRRNPSARRLTAKPAGLVLATPHTVLLTDVLSVPHGLRVPVSRECNARPNQCTPTASRRGIDQDHQPAPLSFPTAARLYDRLLTAVSPRHNVETSLRKPVAFIA